MQAVAMRGATRDKASDSDARLDFTELFQLHYPRIYNYFRYRLASQDDAEDLVSMAFELAYAHREQFDVAKGTFSVWLFSIAHNLLANYYRARQRRLAYEAEGELPADLVAPDPSPETQVLQEEAITRMLEGLRRLGERDQEVIGLKFAGQLSNREIGHIMKLNEKTVSVVLWRAMRRLQQHLTGDAK